MIVKYLLSALLFVFLSQTIARGQGEMQTFYLKDGSTIQGKIIAQDDSTLVVETKYGILEIRKERIVKQEEIEQLQEQLSNSEKLAMYEGLRKRPVTALLLALILPSTGHAYAGNWLRGLPFAVIRIGFFILIGTSMEEQYTYGDFNSDKNIPDKAYLGAIGYAFTTIFEMVDAATEADKYNQKLWNRIQSEKPGLGVNITPYKDGVSLRLSYSM